MNTYEKCTALRRFIINRAAEVMAYKNWDYNFAAKQIRLIPEDLMNKVRDGGTLFNIDPTLLTKKQMEDLGFMRWSSASDMMLIPLWLLPFLKKEIIVEDINGRKSRLYIEKTDNDHRGGCLAYGVNPKRS